MCSAPYIRSFISLLLICMSVPLCAWKPIFIGHRGCNIGVMNTEEAFLAGLMQYGYQGLECDVRFTADGYYVISHDETTNAVGGNLRVERATLSQLQAEVYTQTRNGVTYTGHICTLDRYLQICEDYAAIPVIELKYSTGLNSNDMSNFPGLYQLICEHHLENRAVILTSMLNSLIYVRQNYPNLRCQYLLASLTDVAFDNCVRYGLEPSVEFPKLTPCDLQRCHNAGLQMATYTCNWQEWYDKVAPMGVYMVTTDNLVPAQMAEQDSVEWAELCEAVLDSFPVYVTEKFSYTHAEGTLPAHFPTGKSAKQGLYRDGIFYANDNLAGCVFACDTLGQVVTTELPASLQSGFCRDDAGNLIMDNSPSPNVPSRLLIYTSTDVTADTLTFQLTQPGKISYLSASGNVSSQEGGYIWLYAKGNATVHILHVVNSRLDSLFTSGVLSVSAPTVGYVLPFGNNPSCFFYQANYNGFYRYQDKDRGPWFTESMGSSAPARNHAVGGAVFELDGHRMLIHSSGTDYCGGWTLRDMSAGKCVLFSRAPLASYVSSREAMTANPGYGSFFTVIPIDDNTVDVYEYTLGAGIGGWRISTQEPNPISALETSAATSHAKKIIQNGMFCIYYQDRLYSVLGQLL